MRSLLLCLASAILLTGEEPRPQAQPKTTKAERVDQAQTQPAPPSASKSDVVDILVKAIEAHGGEEKLATYNAARARARGILDLDGDYVRFTTVTTAQLPGYLKTDMLVNWAFGQVRILQVLDGDRGWLGVWGGVQELRNPELAELKEAMYAAQVQSLTPLISGIGYELEPVEEIRIYGRPAVGFRVTMAGRKPITLFFDKENRLLVRSERRSIDGRGRDVFLESWFRNYREIDGVKIPMRVTMLHNGRLFMDGEITSYQSLAKLPASEFAMPVVAVPAD